MKYAVCICCDDKYVPLSIISLRCFKHRNQMYDMYIIGLKFSSESKKLCSKYRIITIECDLRSSFNNLEGRPYGKQYPIECFYHFYVYKILNDYDYIVKIEPDIYTNKTLDIDLTQVEYIGGSYCENFMIDNFPPIKNDLVKIEKVYENLNLNQNRILGGVVVYNVNGINKINFYEKIVEYYQKSHQIGAPRCGDDSLMGMYQMLNKEHVKLLDPYFNVIMHKISLDDVNDVYHFHFGGTNPKYWEISKNMSKTAAYFRDKFISYIYDNFDPYFIKTNLPSIYTSTEKI